MSALELILLAIAIVAGLTGSWSPCGFSMVATLGPGGHPGKMRTTLVSCFTFALTAPLGGIVTFTGLSLIGAALHGAGDQFAYVTAGALAVLGALGEFAGLPIVPQIRRQVPERWRRVLPLPVAGALYGFLLGLGFTTFVLTYAVPVLAAITLAVGKPWLGVAVGVAFGVGRALPIVVLAPLERTKLGGLLIEAMSQRPVLLRSLRALDGLVLAACATLLIADPAVACLTGERGFDRRATGLSTAPVKQVIAKTTSPSTSGDRVAWEEKGGVRLTGPSQNVQLAGTDPALGGNRLALRSGSTVRVLDSTALAANYELTIPGAEKLAVSENWLVVKVGSKKGGRILAYQLTEQPLLKPTKTIVSVTQPTDLGRPALDGNQLVYTLSTRSSSQLVIYNLVSDSKRIVRSSKLAAFGNPSLLGQRLLYTVSTPLGQQLRLGKAKFGQGYRDKLLYKTGGLGTRDRGHERRHQYGHGCLRRGEQPRQPADRVLWSTALTSSYAYVSLLSNPSLTPTGIAQIELKKTR